MFRGEDEITDSTVNRWIVRPKSPPSPLPPTVGNGVNLFLSFFCLQTAKFFCVTSIANKLGIVGCPKPAMMSDHTKKEFWCTFGELQKQNPLMNSIKLLKRSKKAIFGVIIIAKNLEAGSRTLGLVPKR